MIERWRARPVNPPRLFAHREHSKAGALSRSEVHVAHFGEGIAHRVVDRSLADLASLDVGDWDSESESDRRRGQQLVAVGDQQHEVRPQSTEQIGEPERCDPDGFRHSNISVRAEQAFDWQYILESISLHLANGTAELWREMCGDGDDAQIDIFSGGQIFQRP